MAQSWPEKGVAIIVSGPSARRHRYGDAVAHRPATSCSGGMEKQSRSPNVRKQAGGHGATLGGELHSPSAHPGSGDRPAPLVPPPPPLGITLHKTLHRRCRTTGRAVAPDHRSCAGPANVPIPSLQGTSPAGHIGQGAGWPTLPGHYPGKWNLRLCQRQSAQDLATLQRAELFRHDDHGVKLRASCSYKGEGPGPSYRRSPRAGRVRDVVLVGYKLARARARLCAIQKAGPAKFFGTSPTARRSRGGAAYEPTSRRGGLSRTLVSDHLDCAWSRAAPHARPAVVQEGSDARTPRPRLTLPDVTCARKFLDPAAPSPPVALGGTAARTAQFIRRSGKAAGARLIKSASRHAGSK
jgi:hypothetical protein